jgi:predicted AAA+ superfamily ATPase
MLDRHLKPALRDSAATNPVVTLTGPRQSGKTTLVRELFGDHFYLSLEAPDVRARALEDPRGFLAQGEHLTLDEIQRAPELLSYIQVLVDEDDRPGRFILTGSQNLLLMESVSQTLAGRTALLRLHPFSLFELRQYQPLDPRNLDRVESGGPPSRSRLLSA